MTPPSSNRKGIAALVLAVLLGSGPSMNAALLLLDDFDGITTGQLGNTSGWTTSSTPKHSIVATTPGSPTDHVLESTQAQAYSRKATPGVIAETGHTVGTLYFEVYTTGSTTGLSVGLTQAGGSGFGDYRAQMSFNDGISVFNGSASQAIDNITFASETWYHLWMVVDNSANTWSAYILGGDILTVTRLTRQTWTSTFSFRNNAAAPLESLLVARGTGGGEERAYINNVYFGLGDQHGVLPHAPIPEPSSLVLLGSAAALGVLLRRRRWARRG